MIVIDTSAVASIFLRESDAETLAAAIIDDGSSLISAATLLELSMVIRGHKRVDPVQAEAWIDDFMAKGGIGVSPLTEEHARLARQAHIFYGKGSGHGAALNLGDCFSYALAKALNAPLLFKGNDFSKTDIVSALRA